MADIRQSPSSEDKTAFDAESVAGDLWMRQNYQDIHLELQPQEADAFRTAAQAVDLIFSTNESDLAH